MCCPVCYAGGVDTDLDAALSGLPFLVGGGPTRGGQVDLRDASPAELAQEFVKRVKERVDMYMGCVGGRVWGEGGVDGGGVCMGGIRSGVHGRRSRIYGPGCRSCWVGGRVWGSWSEV